MKFKPVILAIFIIFSGSAYAASNNLTVHTADCIQQGTKTKCKLSASDNIYFTKTRGKFNAKNVFIKMSPQVSGELRLYRKEKVTDEVAGEFLLDNFSKEIAYFQYHVIFNDKHGKIAQTKGDIRLLPGKRQKIPFSTVRLREEDIKNIRGYTLKMTLSDQENKPHK